MLAGLPGEDTTEALGLGQSLGTWNTLASKKVYRLVASQAGLKLVWAIIMEDRLQMNKVVFGL